MIDLHSHLLPGIDDGARSMDEALTLAHQTWNSGVTHLMCTPHIHSRIFDNSDESIKPVFQEFVRILRQNACPLKVAYAAEVRISAELTEWVKSKQCMFLGSYQGKKLLLLELPHSNIPAGTDTLISWLARHDVKVVIPHPERNRDILANYEKLLWLKRLGVLFQCTAGAFTGTFKEASRKVALRMLDDNLIDYVASDMHNLHKRPNEMKRAFDIVEKHSEQQIAQALFVETPKLISADVQWI